MGRGYFIMSKVNPLYKTVKILNSDDNLDGLFQYNQFSEQIEFTRDFFLCESQKANMPLIDEDIIQLRYYLSSVHDWEPNKGIVGECCYLISQKKQYHPVKQYIESVKWDGTKRLFEWLNKSTGCVDNAYTQSLSEKFLIAAVNRVYNPGCKFDHMMILEGDQGIGKSTLVEELAGKFYLDTTFENKDKDLVDSIRRSLIVEFGELSGMTKKDVDWMKGFISRKVDRVRLPYAERTKDFARKCVFVGTYNPSGNNTYLRDDTGNRRFYPVECQKIDINYLKENKAQLWAEAYERYKNKETYYVYEDDAVLILKELHSDREFDGPVNDKVKEFLIGKTCVEMDDIVRIGLRINPESKNLKEMASIWSVIGIVMRKSGWIKGKNINRRRYYAPNYKADEPVKKDEVTWDE